MNDPLWKVNEDVITMYSIMENFSPIIDKRGMKGKFYSPFKRLGDSSQNDSYFNGFP